MMPLLLIFSAAVAAEPLAEIREVEEALSGNGTSAIYIKVFGGIVALPNTYVFDSGVRAGARFRRPGGRVLIGSFTDLSDAFLGHVAQRTTGVDEVCGLTVLRWKDPSQFDYELQLVHNNSMYMLFADHDSRIWRAALHMHCEFKRRETDVVKPLVSEGLAAQ